MNGVDFLYPALQQPPPLPESQRPEASHPEAWMPPTQVPVLRPHFMEGAFLADPARLTDPEAPHLDAWWLQTNEPIREIPRSVDKGMFIPDYARLLDPEAPHLEAWWPQTNEPVREIPRPVDTGIFLPDYARLLDKEFPSLDKWRPIYPDQHLYPVRLVPEGSFIPDYKPFTEPEFTFTTWWKQPNEPVREVPRPVDVGTILNDPAQFFDPSTYNWLATYPSLHLIPQRPTPEGLFLPDSARLLDPEFTFVNWYRQTNEPVREIQRPVDEGYNFLEPFPAGSPQLVIPGTIALTITLFPPIIIGPQLVVPGTLALVIATFAATVTIVVESNLANWPNAIASVRRPPDSGHARLSQLDF